MSARDAHHFIQATVADPLLAERVAALGSDPTLEQIVALAAPIGLMFTPEELRSAFVQDWALRTLAVANGSPAGKRDASSAASAI